MANNYHDFSNTSDQNGSVNGDESTGQKDRRFLFGISSSSDDTLIIRGWRIPRTTLLLAVCLAVSALCLLLFVWCAVLQSRVTSVNHKLALASGCLGSDCLRQAAEISGFINKSVDPCENFYEYACGNFDDIHPLGLRFKYNVQRVLKEANERIIEQLLLRTNTQDQDSALSKTRLFYQTCVKPVSESSAQPLLKLIESLGGWRVLNGNSSANNDFQRIFESTRDVHGLRLFFDIFWISKDRSISIRMPMKNVLKNDKFLRATVFERRRNITGNLISALQSEVDSKVNYTGEISHSSVAKRIMDLEEKLSDLIYDNSIGDEEKVSLKKLDQMFSKLRWPQLLNTLFGGAIDLNNVTIKIYPISYMEKLSNLISSTNDSTLVDYVFWKVTQSYLIALGPKFLALSQELSQSLFLNKPFSLRTTCYDMLHQYMSRSLRALFVKEHIGVENVQAADDLYMHIRKLAGQSLGWMTDKVKKASLDFLEAVRHEDGHSNWMMDEDRLNAHYHDLSVDRGSFFKTLMQANDFRSKEVKSNAKFLLKNDSEQISLWVIGETPDTNVAFLPVTNKLLVPSGVLQVPLFSRHNPTHVNSALLGSLMIEALTTPLFIYHKTPDVESWWDPFTDAKFESLKNCVKDSMSGYTLEKQRSIYFSTMVKDQLKGKTEKNVEHFISSELLKLNPTRAINYIMQNYLSFVLTHRLYTTITQQRGVTSFLPGMEDVSVEQLYYLLFTQARCQTTNSQLSPFLHIGLGRFPMDKMINNFVYNSPDFRDAFSCASVPQEHQGRTCSLNGLT